jgi:hypothetical protein
MLKTLLLTALLTLAPAIVAHAGLYQCVDATGRRQIQDTPCTQETTETFMTPESGRPQDPVVAPQTLPAPPTRQPSASLPASRQSDGLCQSIGQTAFHTAIARNKGVTATELLAKTANSFQDLSGQARQASEAYLRSLILQVYANRWWSPTVAQQRIETQCLIAFNK